MESNPAPQKESDLSSSPDSSVLMDRPPSPIVSSSSSSDSTPIFCHNRPPSPIIVENPLLMGYEVTGLEILEKVKDSLEDDEAVDGVAEAADVPAEVEEAKKEEPESEEEEEDEDEEEDDDEEDGFETGSDGSTDSEDYDSEDDDSELDDDDLEENHLAPSSVRLFIALTKIDRMFLATVILFIAIYVNSCIFK